MTSRARAVQRACKLRFATFRLRFFSCCFSAPKRFFRHFSKPPNLHVAGVLEFVTSEGGVYIRGVQSGLFLAMDNDGRLYGEVSVLGGRGILWRLKNERERFDAVEYNQAVISS